MLKEFRDLLGRVKRLEEGAQGTEDAPPCFEDKRKLDFLDEIQAVLDKYKDQA